MEEITVLGKADAGNTAVLGGWLLSDVASTYLIYGN